MDASSGGFMLAPASPTEKVTLRVGLNLILRSEFDTSETPSGAQTKNQISDPKGCLLSHRLKFRSLLI